MAKAKTPTPQRVGTREEREIAVLNKLERMRHTRPLHFAACMALLGDLVVESQARTRDSKKI